MVEAVSVEAVGGGAQISPSRRWPRDRGNAALAGPRTRNSSRPAHGTRPAYSPATSSSPGTRSPARPSSSSRIRRSWSKHGWQAEITAKNHLVLTRVVALKRQSAIGTKADPVMLEVFNNLFMSIAEQMGVALQNTAYSVNIKERLDFSCAVFDADRLAGRQCAAYAGASRLHGPLGRNHHPGEQGTHHDRATSTPSTRPITAAPTCPTSRSARRCSTTAGKRSLLGRDPRPSCRRRRHLAGLDVAERHHYRAGRRLSSTISSWSIADASASSALHDALTGAKYPARNPVQNINDLKAQIAANEKGVQELRKMVAHFTQAWSTPICSMCRTTQPKACAA